MNIYRKQKDANHIAVVNELRRLGVSVVDLSGNGAGCPDLLLYYRGNTVLCELKCGKKAELKKTQVKFMSEYRGHVGIAQTALEAAALAKEPDFWSLTDRQKDKLAGFLLTMDKPKVHLATILKIIE